jgi:hypothetical protein
MKEKQKKENTQIEKYRTTMKDARGVLEIMTLPSSSTSKCVMDQLSTSAICAIHKSVPS